MPHQQPKSTSSQNADGGRLEIVYVSVDTLTPNPRNPRVHSEAQIKALCRSIESFGFNVPVLVGPDGKLVAGHARLLAAKAKGIREVPTISVEHLSEAQRGGG